MKKFKSIYFDNSTSKRPALKKIPKEIYSNTILFQVTTDTIKPSKNSVNYTGKIYLLVDNKVFSSAETFAVFCKQTNFAKVVGTQTAGDGIGTDPVVYTLPNSGLIVRFTAEMGLNSDGSANEETKTIPDIITNSKNLTEIIKLINRK